MNWKYPIGGRTYFKEGKTRPFTAKGLPSLLLKMALILCNQDIVKSRKDILLGIGSPARRGQYTCTFQTLKLNEVLLFKKGTGYIKGERFSEYMTFCFSEMNRLKINNKKLKETILKGCSNTVRFILED